ncbi:lipoate--protein ligase family protein [Shewanella woodyi]|nr:lipoate--protein ligase family protein [Shewanella woodyi]
MNKSIFMDPVTALSWEKNALERIKVDGQYRLLVWEPETSVMVLPTGPRWKMPPESTKQMNKFGWQVQYRQTGGSPVPQTSGVINLSMVYPWPKDNPLSMSGSYQLLIDILTQWLGHYCIQGETGEVEGAYCNGAYNFVVKEQKLIGTAQRISSNTNQQYFVLAHAFILFDAGIPQLIKAVNHCYQSLNLTEVFDTSAMTSLTLLDPQLKGKKAALIENLESTTHAILKAHSQQQNA